MSSKTLHSPISPLRKQWSGLCADPAFADLPYKIETDRSGKIIMSPPSNWHGRFQCKIGFFLTSLLPHGEVITECAIETADGVKAADAAWISLARGGPYFDDVCFPIAPEICVEVASPSNSRKEMLQKMRLYFKTGAQEVWFCDKKGRMEFWEKAGIMKTSRLCPDFPKLIKSQQV